MLYVKESYGVDKYGVYDTDDNTISILSKEEIQCLVESGINVGGVVKSSNSINISIFNPENTINRWLLLNQFESKFKRLGVTIGEFIGLPNYDFDVVDGKIWLKYIHPKQGVFSYKIPDFVYGVGRTAFKNFNSVNTYNIEIGRGLRKLPDKLLSDLHLTNIFIPNNIKSIGKECFYNTIIDGKIVFEDSKDDEDSILFEVRAFSCCKCKNSFEIKRHLDLSSSYGCFVESEFSEISIYNLDNITSVYCFSNMKDLQKVYISGNFKELPVNSFNYCSNLKEVKFEGVLRNINVSAFTECNSLVTVDLQNTELSSIRKSAFSSCNNLVTVLLPNNEIIVDEFAFFTCINLKNIDFKNIISIGVRAFAGCISLNNITLNDKVSLYSEAFRHCNSLSHINLPSNMVSLPAKIFNKCGLKELVIPENVTELNDLAISACPYLTSIQINSEVLTNIELGNFLSCNENLVIKCKSGNVANLVRMVTNNSIPVQII